MRGLHALGGHYERRFFSEGLALAPVPALVPFTPVCLPALGGPPMREGGVSSGRVGGVEVGPRGSRRAWATGGEWDGAPRPRSTEYMRGGGPPFSALSEVCGERLTVVACTIGGDAEAAYERGGGCDRCGERAVTGAYGLWCAA
jgi:hypothetical protein